MRTLGLELCDQGILAAEREDSESRLVPLGVEGLSSPGYVYFNGSGFMVGEEAERCARINPHHVTINCWDQLSLRPSDLNFPGKPPLYSQLAFKHLQYVWKRLLEGGPVGKIVFALPGSYLLGENGDEEKIGLLLGMAQDLEIPLAGIVGMAVGAVAAEAHRLHPSEREAVHLDIHLHATQISQLEVGSSVRRRHLHQSRIGYNNVFNELLLKLSNRFLSQTAFDVTHSAETEQKFYNQTKKLLEELSDKGEGTLEMGGTLRSRKIVVTRDIVERHLEAINTTLAQSLGKALREWRERDRPSPLPVFVTDRAVGIPGLLNKLAGVEGTRIIPLPPGSGATAAARLGVSLAAIEDLEETPLIREIALGNNAFPIPASSRDLSPEERFAGEASGIGGKGERAITPSRTENPTHLVYRGIAYSIDSEGFTIGTGSADLKLPENVAGLAEKHCLLRSEENRIILINNGKGETRLNARPAGEREYLKTGDVLSLGNRPDAMDLLLIHCKGDG